MNGRRRAALPVRALRRPIRFVSRTRRLVIDSQLVLAGCSVLRGIAFIKAGAWLWIGLIYQ